MSSFRCTHLSSLVLHQHIGFFQTAQAYLRLLRLRLLPERNCGQRRDKQLVVKIIIIKSSYTRSCHRRDSRCTIYWLSFNGLLPFPSWTMSAALILFIQAKKTTTMDSKNGNLENQNIVH